MMIPVRVGRSDLSVLKSTGISNIACPNEKPSSARDKVQKAGVRRVRHDGVLDMMVGIS